MQPFHLSLCLLTTLYIVQLVIYSVAESSSSPIVYIPTYLLLTYAYYHLLYLAALLYYQYIQLTTEQYVLYTCYWVGIGLLSYSYTLLSTPYSTICTMLAYPLLLLTYSRVFYGTSMVYIQQRLTLSQTSSSGIGIGMSWSSIESRDAVMTWIVGEVHTLRQLPPPLLLPTTTNSSSNTSSNHNRQSASEDVNSYDHASSSDRVLVNLEKTIVSNRGNTSSNHSNSSSSNSGGEKSDIAVLGEIELIPKQQQQQIMRS